MKHTILFLSCGILASIFLVSCSGHKEFEQNAPLPVSVAVYQVQSGNTVYNDEYPATVAALNQVDIRPEVSGYITGVFFKDGQHVGKNAKLYSIDQQQYKGAYDQALANLNVAKANLAKAQQDADRYNELAEHDAIARQTLEHALNDLQSAKMQVEAASANVNSVQTNLSYSVICAPFDGTIGISLVKLGSSVTAGQTLMNTVSSDNPMAVDCSVDEKQISRFVLLLQKNRNDQDSIFTIVLPDQSAYPHPGRLSFLDRAVDPQTGTIRIRVIFSNPHNILRAGLTCNLRVKATNSSNSLLIPYRAVIEQMGEYFVYVIKDNRATQSKIILGMSLNDKVIVKDGLQAGDQIAMEGIQRLRDNSLVTVVPAGTQPGGELALRK